MNISLIGKNILKDLSGNVAGRALQTILEVKMISRGWWISWKLNMGCRDCLCL